MATKDETDRMLNTIVKIADRAGQTDGVLVAAISQRLAALTDAYDRRTELDSNHLAWRIKADQENVDMRRSEADAYWTAHTRDHNSGLRAQALNAAVAITNNVLGFRSPLGALSNEELTEQYAKDGVLTEAAAEIACANTLRIADRLLDWLTT